MNLKTQSRVSEGGGNIELMLRYGNHGFAFIKRY